MKIWIFSHNSTPPSAGQWVRHYMFSKFGDKEKYETVIFASSSIHLSDKNYAGRKGKFTNLKFEDVQFQFVNLKSYDGKKYRRVLNMIKFCWVLVFNSTKEMGYVPDAIYASSPDPFSWLAGRILSWKHGISFVAETRDLWPETFVELNVIKRNSLVAKLLYMFEKYIYTKADKLVFTFQGGIDYLLEKKIDKKSNDVYSINNGVNLEEFKHNSNKFQYKNEYLSDPLIKTIVYTGSLGKANDLFVLLHLALKLKRFEVYNVKIIIFGEGLDKERLIRFKEKNSLHNVEFIGRVDKKYVPSILSQADINMIVGFQNNLYRFGYSFNKLFDYMAAGKPIISSVKTNYDLIEKYHIGETVDMKDDLALYNCVMKYLTLDKKSLEDLHKRSIDAANIYDYSSLSKQFYKIFEEEGEIL